MAALSSAFFCNSNRKKHIKFMGKFCHFNLFIRIRKIDIVFDFILEYNDSGLLDAKLESMCLLLPKAKYICEEVLI